VCHVLFEVLWKVVEAMKSGLVLDAQDPDGANGVTDPNMGSFCFFERWNAYGKVL
jgi:hypothetical protein